MSGCGGCTPGQCNGPCSRKAEAPRDRYTLTDALARVVIDNRVAVRAIELYEAGITDKQEIVTQINLDKTEGRL